MPTNNTPPPAPANPPAAEATARPWQVTPDGFRVWSDIGSGKLVAYTATNNAGRTPEARATAALIVAAVNSHESLLACRQELAHLVRLAEERTWPSEATLERARAALAEAEEAGE